MLTRHKGAPFGGNVSASKVINNIGTLVHQGMEDLPRVGCSLQTLEPLHKAESAFSRALVRRDTDHCTAGQDCKSQGGSSEEEACGAKERHEGSSVAWANHDFRISQTVCIEKVARICLDRTQWGTKCYAGEIDHMETFADEDRAIKWLGNIQLDNKWYLIQGASSGDVRCMFLSPHAIGAATVCNIDDIATQDEFREYFKTYGPIIFTSLKNDKKTLNQRGHGGAAANLAKDMGWALVMQATNADRAERIMGSI